MGLKLVKANAYAIRAMIYLACLPEGARAMRNEIAEAQKIPSSFMAKILRGLVRSRLLTSARGVNGGFALARPAAEITVLDIIEAIEGPLSIAACVPDPRGCAYACDCPAGPVWGRVQSAMEKILRGTTLEALVSMPRRNGRVVGIPEIRAVG